MCIYTSTYTPIHTPIYTHAHVPPDTPPDAFNQHRPDAYHNICAPLLRGLGNWPTHASNSVGDQLLYCGDALLTAVDFWFKVWLTGCLGRCVWVWGGVVCGYGFEAYFVTVAWWHGNDDADDAQTCMPCTHTYTHTHTHTHKHIHTHTHTIHRVMHGLQNTQHLYKHSSQPPLYNTTSLLCQTWSNSCFLLGGLVSSGVDMVERHGGRVCMGVARGRRWLCILLPCRWVGVYICVWGVLGGWGVGVWGDVYICVWV